MKDETRQTIFLGVFVFVVLVLFCILIATINFTGRPKPEPKEVMKTPQELMLEAQNLSIDTQKQIIEAIKSGNKEKLKEAAKQKGVLEALKASGLQDKLKNKKALEVLKARFGGVEKRLERTEQGPMPPRIPRPEDLERFPPKTETIQRREER